MPQVIPPSRLVPKQAGNAGKYLKTDGTVSSWQDAPAVPVSSVFGRTGAVVAVSGDYTAAQVTDAVSVLGSYANPSWITSLANAKVTGLGSAALANTSAFDAAGAASAALASANGYTDSSLVSYVPVTRTVNGHALSANVTVSKSDVGLGSVENTAISTWAGTSSITSVGTLTSGSIPYSLITGAPGGGGSPANPTATIGLTAINGSSSTTFMRSDAAPALSQAIAPTWTAGHIWAPTASGAVAAKFRASTTSPGNVVEFQTSGGTAVGYWDPAVGLTMQTTYAVTNLGTGILRAVDHWVVNSPYVLFNDASGVGNNVTIYGGTGASQGAYFYPPAAGSKGVIIQGRASQSGNLTEWQNSSSTVLASVSAGGCGLFAAGSTSAPGLGFTGTSTGFWRSGTSVFFTDAGTTYLVLADNIVVNSDVGIKWSSGSVVSDVADVGLARSAAAKVVLTNGSTGAGSLVLRTGGNVEFATSGAGTKLGTATTQLLGFWNVTPVVQPSAIADADALTVVAQLNSLLAAMRTVGMIAT